MASMSEDPDRDPASADERRIRELLAAVQPPAPTGLQARIAELNAAAAPPSRGLRAPRLRLPAARSKLALALAGACAAAVVAVVVAVSLSGGEAPPTALRTAELALAPMQAPAPLRLAASGTSIVFPDWSARGWPSAGMRRDRLDGRIVTTELYRSYDSATIGYAIVSGGALRWGSGAGRTVATSDGSYRVSGSSARHVVAWVQEGHTCVLASRTVPVADLLVLAEQESASATAARSAPASMGVGWVPM
jgi:hypothetical protein